jgi:hypothetical protein
MAAQLENWIIVAALATCFSCGARAEDSLAPQVSECDLFLHQSTIDGAGRGVIAGKDYDANDLVLWTPTVLVPAAYSDSCQLSHYVFGGYDARYHELSLNYVSLVNHYPTENANRFAMKDDRNDTISFSTFGVTVTERQLVSLNAIKAGDELFINYGGSGWFDSHATPYKETRNPILPLDVLRSTGYCISHTIIGYSHLGLAGMGLFANKQFVTGETVAIDPVLTIPTHSWSSITTEMVNYCVSKPGSAVGLLLLGAAAFVNHRSAPDANVLLEWFDWPRGNLSEVLSLPMEDLLARKFSQLDIKLVATRHIDKGEEILLDYGQSWLQSWADFLADRDLLEKQYQCVWMEAGHSSENKSRFTHHIEAPDNMFPSHWFVDSTD